MATNHSGDGRHSGDNTSRRGGRSRSRRARGGKPHHGRNSTPQSTPGSYEDADSEIIRFAKQNDVVGLAQELESCNRDFQSWTPSFTLPYPRLEAQEKKNPLIAAAANDAIDAMQLLLHKGVDPNSLGSVGITALTAATVHGHDDVALFLLSQGASVDVSGPTGITALHAAAQFRRVDLIETFAEHPTCNVNAVDIDDQTALHKAAIALCSGAISSLLNHGAAVTHDKGGFSALYYSSKEYEKHSKHLRKPKNKGRGGHFQNPVHHGLPSLSSLLECVVSLANATPFLYDTFRTVSDRHARDAIVRSIGAERVMAVLALRTEALEDTELFNEILLTLVRTLKADKRPLRVSSSDLCRVLTTMVTEASRNSLSAFASLLTQPYCAVQISLDDVAQIASALQAACRMCIFGHQPYVDFSIDFVHTMTIAWLRLVCALAEKTPVEDLNALGAQFDHFWNMLDECLIDIDFNIQEADRFAVLIFAYFHHSQVFPLNTASLQEITPTVPRPFIVASDDEAGSIALAAASRKRGQRLNRHGEPGFAHVPKITWFVKSKPISLRFQQFASRRYNAIRHIADDTEEYWGKYFGYMLRVGDISRRSYYIQLAASRSHSLETNPVSINRFLMTGSHADGDAYEHFVQQMMTLPPAAFEISLPIEFLHEPGIGEGPLRELLQMVSKILFPLQPRDASSTLASLFVVAPSGNAFHLSSPPIDLDSAAEQHLFLHWEMAGRMTGLSVTTSFPLGVRFTDALLRRMLDLDQHEGEDVKDKTLLLAGFDDDLAVRLRWLAHNEIDALGLDMRWSYTDITLCRDVPLVPGGQDMVVQDSNKLEFISTLVERRLWGTAEQKALTSAFIKGFQDVLQTADCISSLSVGDLSHLLQGAQALDLNWMRIELVSYSYGYNAESPVIVWFWRYVSELDAERLSRLLQFWSGSPVPPLPHSMVTDHWTICPHLRPVSSLPSSATCTRQLSIPRYVSFEQLMTKFNTALEFGYIGYSST
uniref:E3 ubiquitin-protein ligase HACE1 n=1 Tax=Spongospora subterranea TaxID=70186 RepID=A0A0H5QGZ3_9EUKA|eukprot:CRZ01255.1 hypothetical protein [Spongospora subterranea]